MGTTNKRQPKIAEEHTAEVKVQKKLVESPRAESAPKETPASKGKASAKNAGKTRNAAKLKLPESKKAKTPRKTGRPSIYTQELADSICAELANGTSMRTVCKRDDMPSMDCVFRWLREKPEFNEQYVKAKQESADALVEEMMDIADNGENDWMVRHGKDGEESWVVNGEHVQRSRLRLDTRKWIASKLKPKKYGDKLDMNHGVQPDNPLAKLLEQVTGTKFQVKDE